MRKKRKKAHFFPLGKLHFTAIFRGFGGMGSMVGGGGKGWGYVAGGGGMWQR